MPAPRPTDPLTIEVIKAEGLDVEEGIGWPYDGSKEMSLAQLTDYQAPQVQDSFMAYCLRHYKDSYGYVAANTIGLSLPQVFDGFDPGGEVYYTDRRDVKVGFTMVKAPIIPTRNLAPAEYEDFKNFMDTHEAVTGHMPGLQALAEHFTARNIPFRTSYPATLEPEGAPLWPDGFTGEEYK
jgi:hypothetical protein